MKFEIGEIAIVAIYDGLECEIVALPGHGMDLFVNSEYIINIPALKNANRTDGLWSSPEYLLRKKPKFEAGSWESEAFNAIGWNPTKVEA